MRRYLLPWVAHKNPWVAHKNKESIPGFVRYALSSIGLAMRYTGLAKERVSTAKAANAYNVERMNA